MLQSLLRLCRTAAPRASLHHRRATVGSIEAVSPEQSSSKISRGEEESAGDADVPLPPFVLFPARVCVGRLVQVENIVLCVIEHACIGLATSLRAHLGREDLFFFVVYGKKGVFFGLVGVANDHVFI